MAWTIEYSETALKQLSKLDRAVAKRIRNYLSERLAAADNPKVSVMASQATCRGIGYTEWPTIG